LQVPLKDNEHYAMPREEYRASMCSVATGGVAGRGQSYHGHVMPDGEQVISADSSNGARDAQVRCGSATIFLLQQFDALNEFVTNGVVADNILSDDSHLISSPS
jgi:hypothetical protein